MQCLIPYGCVINRLSIYWLQSYLGASRLGKYGASVVYVGYVAPHRTIYYITHICSAIYYMHN